MLPQQHFMPCTNQGLHPGMQAMPLDINLPTTTMAQDTMAFGNNALAACSISFTNPYNLATTFNAGMPTVPHPHHMNDWSSYGGVSMAPVHVPDMRRDSIASLQSCPPLIKSEEEQSPIHPSQMFYNTPMYSSQRESSSPSGTEDGKESNFSTDVDVLMKAIQSKHKQPAQPKPMVLPHFSQRLVLKRTNHCQVTPFELARTSYLAKASKEIPMLTSRLQQVLLSKDTSRNTHSRAHWCEALCKKDGGPFCIAHD